MKEKTILILVDGMRPDALTHPFAGKLIKEAYCDLKAKTVMPSVTLPCHMSLFHSVDPQRHGILSNTYVPQVRPVIGLMDLLAANGKKCASFYNWEQLRDLSRPGSLAYSHYMSLHAYAETDRLLTEQALCFAQKQEPDFIFLYLGQTDDAGHTYGWMTEQYQTTVNNAWDCIERVCNELGAQYNIVITADHGGHDRMHGTELEEDMNIPVIVYTDRPLKGKSPVCILDLAPTIAAFYGLEANQDWEGVSLV